MGVFGRQKDVMEDIERGALDPDSDLPTVLRKCIALGGRTGSTELRQWASLELNGYGPDDAVPGYREYSAPVFCDGATMTTKVTGQLMQAHMMPEEVREVLVDTDQVFRAPVSELVGMYERAVKDGRVSLAPPAVEYIVTLVNHQLGPGLVVERIYWAIDPITVSRVLDVVRTKLVELVAEMRAGTPIGSELPTGEVADQAVGVVVKGIGNRLVVNQVGAVNGDVTTAVGGTISSGSTPPESVGRRAFWWVFGAAAVIGAGAAVVALFLG